MSLKNTGKFAMAYRVLDEAGNPVEVRARITDDIVLKKGQTIFFNEFVEDIKSLAQRNIISPEEADERIKTRERLDKEYNQQTAYSLRAGKVTDGEGLVGKVGTSKL